MVNSETNPPKVFISYSHDSAEHADRVLELSNRLRADGIDSILDQYVESPPEGWPRWMDRQIHDADFVLMICTPAYYRRVMGEEEPNVGFGVRWEGNLIYQKLYNAGTLNTRFIPILFEGGSVADIPTPLQGTTYYRFTTKSGYEELYRLLTNQPRTIKPQLGRLNQLPPRDRKQYKGDISTQSSTLARHFEYDIALSYAGEDSNYADALASALKSRGVKVFFDKFEKGLLWGKNLYDYLTNLYQHKAHYCVMLLSQHYAVKVWTNLERQAAQARAFLEHQEYILPVRLDDTEIPGILPTVAYLKWPPETAETIADAIMTKLET